MSHGIYLSKDMWLNMEGKMACMNRTLYGSAVGSIMYPMMCTMPNISYTLSVTNIYQANLDVGDWMAIKNILNYLTRTKDMILTYGGNNLQVEDIDASFQSDKDDNKSQYGYMFTQNSGVLT